MIKLDDKLKGVQTVGISGHVRPDGDCVGSTLAVYNYISTYYPQITVDLYLESIPNVFDFLKNASKIHHSFEETAKQTFCIDHHVSNQSFADDNYIYPDASSTCELVYELLDTDKITKEIAECLYTGMVHDTGVFQYSCTSAKTMNIAGILMEKGINYSKIVDDTFYTKTYNQNRILGQALLDSKLYLNGKVIATYVTVEQMKAFECGPKHLDGIVNQLRVTKDVVVAAFLYENEDASFKVSLRANGDFNVADVVAVFGGGGHVKAAGCTMEGAVEDILERLMNEIEKRL